MRSSDLAQLGTDQVIDMTVIATQYDTLTIPVPALALGENVIIEWNFVSDTTPDNFSGLTIDNIEVSY